MRIKEIQLYNRAPFDNLILHFDNSNISVFSGINGTGKTTIISYIVDAFYEFAKKAFYREFEDTSNKFYRVSSSLQLLSKNTSSFVYIRFENQGDIIDYIDIRNLIDREDYLNAIKINNPISYETIKGRMGSRNVLKYSNHDNEKEIEKIFDENILTYFPAYRYEKPAYLNEPYSISLSFKKEMDFFGYLTNPIEVTSELDNIANWIMDIVLDRYIYRNSTDTISILNHINNIFTALLQSKIGAPVRLGIGPRQNGATRIQIMNKSNDEQVYPSIFSMSSGEHALISLFCELLRQADNIGKTINNVSGIVLVDEIDKHLHIKLQKEILPKLIKLFPNIQFIITSHSPFFSLGLADEDDSFYKIYNLDNNGIACTPHCTNLFKEVYDMMIEENNQYVQKYNKILEEIKDSNTPLLITEGKTDWKHLKAAQKALNITDINIEYYEYEDAMGDATLLNILKQIHIISPNRKIIGMFDRDKDDICTEVTTKTSNYVELSKNVFAFAIPIANENEYGKHTSIEHYYPKKFLLKENTDGHRLFLGSEFYLSGVSKCNKYLTRTSQIQHKAKINGVIDEKVYVLDKDPECNHSIALSKNIFAQMILDENEFAHDADFTNFQEIFNVLREIIAS